MTNPLENLEPKAVFHYFGELGKHPRPSKKEGKVVAYIQKWASEKNIKCITDEVGNLILSKPATPGMEDRQSVCFQGHLDMVCVAEKGHEIDFENDPIDMYIDGDWIKARGTTLGGDNGIAIAMGMALLDSTDIPHPAIELLCTLDEEEGLGGANGLSKGILQSKLLVNVDSEDEGVFTIGCAGGINTIAHYKYVAKPIPISSFTPFKVVVDGLKGGHSGIEINAGRANASKVLTRILWNVDNLFNTHLSSFNGGSKHNAIPSEAEGVIIVPNECVDKFKTYITEMNEIVKSEFSIVEPNLRIIAEDTEMPKRILSKEAQFKLLASFYAMPHGVLRMSPNPDTKGLVQSSTNFAIVQTLEDEIMVLTSQRSSVDSEKRNIAEKVKAVFLLGDATVEQSDGYPAWEPRAESPLVDLCKKVWKDMYGTEAVIDTIHAGLECGVIGDKYPGMDMISIGPNLYDVHSPKERLSIASTKKMWDFICELLKNIPKA